MNYKMTDTEFHLENPQDVSGLYMPLVNEKVMSCVTPDGHGDNKISQDCFFLEPVSIENLHSSMSTRNFWCRIDGCDKPWSVFGYSVWQQAKRHTKDTPESEKVSMAAGPYWQEVKRVSPAGLESAVLSFCPVGGDDGGTDGGDLAQYRSFGDDADAGGSSTGLCKRCGSYP